MPALAILGAVLCVGSAVAETGPSGLPVPRFASLAGERINVRTGPGKQYPIRWIYARAGLPVKITGEFDTWRRIEDHEGGQGWVHVSLLSGRRTVLARGTTVLDVRREPAETARIDLRVEPGVVARLVACDAAWCEIEVERERGWMKRAELWGLLDAEVVTR